MWFLNKNNFISQKYRSFTGSRIMGSGNILWKFDLDQIIFLDFTGIGSLKYKEIRVSGAKLFLRSIYQYMLQILPFFIFSRDTEFGASIKQKRSTEGYSKFKSPETRQVQERLVSTLEHMQVPKWNRTRCPEE